MKRGIGKRGKERDKMGIGLKAAIAIAEKMRMPSAFPKETKDEDNYCL